MEPIILIRTIDIKGEVPDQTFPIYSLGISKRLYCDNRNDESISVEERNKVTRTTYAVAGMSEDGVVSIFESDDMQKSQAVYDDIFTAIDSGKRTYTQRYEEKEDKDNAIETDRDSTQD